MQTGEEYPLPMSAQNKAAMAPTIPATPKLLRVRPEAPPLLPELLVLEGEEPLEVLVELSGRSKN